MSARTPGPDAWPECEEFYNLMQVYRHEPLQNVEQILANYEAVKQWLRANAYDADRALIAEAVQLLRESQTSIAGDWRERRDLLLSRIPQ